MILAIAGLATACGGTVGDVPGRRPLRRDLPLDLAQLYAAKEDARAYELSCKRLRDALGKPYPELLLEPSEARTNNQQPKLRLSEVIRGKRAKVVFFGMNCKAGRQLFQQIEAAGWQLDGESNLVFLFYTTKGQLYETVRSRFPVYLVEYPFTDAVLGYATAVPTVFDISETGEFDGFRYAGREVKPKKGGKP